MNAASPGAGCAVVVFARAPEPGRVKTRLAATLGDAAALAIYRELGQRTADALHALGTHERSGRCAAVICCTPDDGAPAVRAWLGDHWPVEPQGGGDLGERMAAAIARRFDAGAARVVVIGTDCPDLDAAVIRAAFDRLDDHDAVLGPALDGGYYLIGVRRPLPALFEGVPWSAPDTLRATLARADAHGISVALLHALGDIDTADDWRAWQDARAR